MSRWWRRNRWALLALPFVILLALAGNSLQVGPYYLRADLRDPVVVEPGEWAETTAVSIDAQGEQYERPVRARLVGVGEATSWWGDSTPIELPPGTRALAVDLELAAGDDADLTLCQLEVVGDDGTRYGYSNALTGAFQSPPCLLPDAPGFTTDPFGLGANPEDRERPRSWSTSPVVVLPEDVSVSEVRLWWSAPDYLALRTR